MPEDFKTFLGKVLHSNGKKKFFFAYGTGKRTDGKGDGHLIVAKKKPKKADVQEECACQAFAEGFCWSSPDGATLFFQGKGTKIGATLIAKMSLTAKKMTGRQYDFQIPSAEEEQRADSLGEGGETETEEKETEETETTAPSAGPDLKAEWLKRRHALEPALLAALKEQRGDVSKLRAVFAFSVEKADASEYQKALQGLDNLEKLLEAARSSEPKSGDGAPGKGKPGDAEAFFKEWKAAQSELHVAIEKVSNQLEEFAVAIMDTGEENLEWVAEEGLGQIMTEIRDVALRVDRAISKDPAKVVAKAKPAIEDLRKQLKSPQVEACDTNQLDVTVTIQDTIGKAIKRLESALAGAK